MTVANFMHWVTLIVGALVWVAVSLSLVGAALGAILDRINREIDRRGYETFEMRMRDLSRYCFDGTVEKSVFESLATRGGWSEPWEAMKPFKKRYFAEQQEKEVDHAEK